MIYLTTLHRVEGEGSENIGLHGDRRDWALWI